MPQHTAITSASHCAGYLDNGFSEPGLAGGSGISPNGWLFNICLQPERCSVLDSYDPGNGLAVWFTRIWQASKT